jgi:hypothetical protein
MKQNKQKLDFYFLDEARLIAISLHKKEQNKLPKLTLPIFKKIIETQSPYAGLCEFNYYLSKYSISDKTRKQLVDLGYNVIYITGTLTIQIPYAHYNYGK